MGCPAIVLATNRFAGFARESAQGYGLPAARIAVVEHPLGGTAPEVVVARARLAVDDVMRLLLGGGLTS